MESNDILARIAREAQIYHLPADTALEAYANILTELADRLAADDLEALIAIGTVLMRYAGPDGSDPPPERQRLRLVPDSSR